MLQTKSNDSHYSLSLFCLFIVYMSGGEMLFSWYNLLVYIEKNFVGFFSTVSLNNWVIEGIPFIRYIFKLQCNIPSYYTILQNK